MSRKRSISTRWVRTLTAVGAVGALALAGCSAAEEAPSDPNAPVTIDWWSWNPDDVTNEQFVKAFEDAHPNITVKHRFVQNADYVNTARLALTTDSGPDVFGLQVGSMTEQLAPLATDLSGFAAENLGDDWADQLLAVDQLSVGDKQVGLPWMVTGAGLMWVNQTVLDEAGASVPTNLQEWKETCTTLEAAGKKCLVQGAKDAWQNIDVFQAIANQVSPGYFYEALEGDEEFDSPEMVEALEVWKQLFDDGIVQEGALGTAAYPDAADSFRKGEAGMIAFGTWQNSDTTHAKLAQFAETYGDPAIQETIFMPVDFPVVAKGAETNGLAGGPDVGWAISAKSKKQEAAWKLVEWLSASEEGQTMIGTTLQQPALKGIPIDMSDVVNDAQRAALDAQAPRLDDLVGARQISNASVEASLGDALSSVASDQMSPSDAAKAVQSAIATAE